MPILLPYIFCGCINQSIQHHPTATLKHKSTKKSYSSKKKLINMYEPHKINSPWKIPSWSWEQNLAGPKN